MVSVDGTAPPRVTMDEAEKQNLKSELRQFDIDRLSFSVNEPMANYYDRPSQMGEYDSFQAASANSTEPTFGE